MPPGIHCTDISSVESVFAINPGRRQLFEGLKAALLHLRDAGCTLAYLDGSYVTSKPNPRDFDLCWDPTDVDPRKLNPSFLTRSGRTDLKKRFGGDFFPSSITCTDIGRSFLDFFQLDRFTGEAKGILAISLKSVPSLQEGGPHDS